MVGLSLALILVLGNPWRGTTFVGGHPIDVVIRDLGTGYFDVEVTSTAAHHWAQPRL